MASFYGQVPAIQAYGTVANGEENESKQTDACSGL